MEKPAKTQYPIHELLGRRWSPRASDRPVAADTLRSLLEAARWAPSWPRDARSVAPACTLDFDPILVRWRGGLAGHTLYKKEGVSQARIA